jgi:ACS family pantothenate transporter-like MFS transporter
MATLFSNDLRFYIDNLMLQVISPRIWFPTMQIIWGILTFWYTSVFDIPSLLDVYHR